MVGNVPNPVPDGKLALRLADINIAMLLVHVMEQTLRRLHQPSKTDLGRSHQTVRGERLRSTIHDHVPLSCRRDTRGHDRNPTVPPSTAAAPNRIDVVVDVCSRPDLTQSGDLVRS